MRLYPNTLLVEGKDGFNVIRNLWVAQFPSDNRGPIVLCPDGTIDFKIEQAGEKDENGGDSKLLEFLAAHLKQRPPSIECLGVVLDANDSLDRRWARILGRLRQTGYGDLPQSPPADGLVLEHPDKQRPRVGVWLMPDNRLPGKIEDFVKLLIPQDDMLGPKAEVILKYIEQQGLQKYKPKDRPKVFIHTWLAWQKDPGRPMGLAITNRALDPASPNADVFVNWLRRLFCSKY